MKTNLYPNEMLKVDVNLCKTYMPNTKVKQYIKSPSKMIRNILFDSNIFMTIESQCMNGEYWQEINRINDTYTPQYKINLLKKFNDKQNRKIYIYNVLDNNM
jgi:5'(3')-deoxyribonucleotidase